VARVMEGVTSASAPGARRPWVVALAVWALIGVGAGVQRYLGGVLLGGPASLGVELGTSLPRYLVWGALTPAVWYLSRRFPLAGRGAGRHALMHLAGCAAYVAVQTAAFTLADLAYAGIVRPPGAAVFGMTLLSYAPYDLVLYLAIVGVYHAVTYHRAYVARAVKDAQLETRLAQSELDVLRAHLQPRFLFESLDSVSELMERDVRGARKALADLSELLRLSLNEGGGRPVSLAEEVELLERYFSVRALAEGGAVRLRLDVPLTAREALVPPALLQPLADDLLAGGPDTAGAPADLLVRAGIAQSTLRLEIRVHHSTPADGPSALMDAVEARLDRIYGGRAALRRRSAPGGGTAVEVEVPLRLPGQGAA
jgi:two-component system LytT family sensor kinase